MPEAMAIAGRSASLTQQQKTVRAAFLDFSHDNGDECAQVYGGGLDSLKEEVACDEMLGDSTTFMNIWTSKCPWRYLERPSLQGGRHCLMGSLGAGLFPQTSSLLSQQRNNALSAI